jgi:hypothetical protein
VIWDVVLVRLEKMACLQAAIIMVLVVLVVVIK